MGEPAARLQSLKGAGTKPHPDPTPPSAAQHALLGLYCQLQFSSQNGAAAAGRI